MSDTAHAILAPSSMNTVVVCPGSIQLRHMYPEDEDSQDAREGTASHWAGSETLLGRDVAVGHAAPNNVTLDIEMLDGADMYVDAVRERVPVGGHVEERVDCSFVHPLMWGTPDFWHYDPITRTLWVMDYKYGKRFVEVFENWQLIAYAAGIISMLDLSDLSVTINFVIIQPRNYHRDGPVRTWSIAAVHLRPYVNKLAGAAYAAVRADGSYTPDAKCVVNPACRDCTGRRGCVTLQTSAMADCDLAGAPVPFDLSPIALGNELRMIQRAIDQLKARATGLEEQAISNIMRGVQVPWYRLARTEGRERWSKPVQEVIALGALLGHNLAAPAEAITPVQARKLGLDAALVAGYAFRPGGEAKLVPDDGTQARKVFGGSTV